MNISDKELEQAKNLINSFCIGEFGNATDFTKLSSVNIAYTTITDAEIPIQVTLDLERYYLMRTLDGHVIDKEEYDTFQDFYENCLEVLNFDDLVYVTDEQLQAFYGSLTYSLDNLAYNSDGTVDFDVVRDYAPNIPGKFMIYNDQSKGSEDEAQVLSLSGFTFSEDADRRKEEVKYINAHYTDIENTLVDLTKSRYMEHFLLRTKDKASTIEAGSLIKEAYNGIKLIRNSEDYKRWLNFYDGFHQYSFNNTMLIYMQNPSASLCAGFNTWKNKKRYVKAGEKGLKILAPIMQQEETDNYMHNLITACKLEYTTYKNFGILASLFPTYNRSVEKEKRSAEAKAQQEPYRNSEWIGKEKERINITVSTFSCLTSWENDYGYTYIYRITDDKNNVYTWKTSNCLGENSVKSLTGTVKTHTEYRGIKQTELTRCRVEAKEPILEPVEEVETPSSVSDFVEWYDKLFGDEQKHQNCDLEK